MKEEDLSDLYAIVVSGVILFLIIIESISNAINN